MTFPLVFPLLWPAFSNARWFCSYRSGDGRWLKKSTKQTNRRKALEFCFKLEEAEQAALNRTLTTAQARKLFNEVLERAGDEPLDNFTVEEWLREWVATKKAARGRKTGERYEKPVRDFLEHLGSRASLPLRAVLPKTCVLSAMLSASSENRP
jgi:hypothetical protein